VNATSEKTSACMSVLCGGVEEKGVSLACNKAFLLMVIIYSNCFPVSIFWQWRRENGAVKGGSRLSTSNVNSNTSVRKKYPSGGEPISYRKFCKELQGIPRSCFVGLVLIFSPLRGTIPRLN